MIVPGDHSHRDNQSRPVPGDHLTLDDQPQPVSGDHSLCGSHASSVPGDHPPRDPQVHSVPEDAIAYEMLAFHSAMLDDAEHARIAAENRLRAMLDPEPRSGAKSIDPRLPEIAVVQEVVERCQAFEHQAELELVRSLRKHPLGGWVKRMVGIGEKQGARLIAAIGDPVWNAAAGRPRRGPAELQAYCGLHVVPAQANPGTQARYGGNGGHPGDQVTSDHHGMSVPGVAPRRQRGQKANWNPVARSRFRLVAESCKKQRHSPYRAVYDAGRAKYADAVHSAPCPQCGGKGDPLPAGSPLRPGHQDSRALRLVAKAILQDLWREARTLT